MPRNSVHTFIYYILFFSSILLIGSACNRDVTCPTGHQESKDMFAAAEKGKSATKKRTENGLIKKKNPSKKKKKRK